MRRAHLTNVQLNKKSPRKHRVPGGRRTPHSPGALRCCSDRVEPLTETALVQLLIGQRRLLSLAGAAGSRLRRAGVVVHSRRLRESARDFLAARGTTPGNRGSTDPIDLLFDRVLWPCCPRVRLTARPASTRREDRFFWCQRQDRLQW